MKDLLSDKAVQDMNRVMLAFKTAINKTKAPQPLGANEMKQVHHLIDKIDLLTKHMKLEAAKFKSKEERLLRRVREEIDKNKVNEGRNRDYDMTLDTISELRNEIIDLKRKLWAADRRASLLGVDRAHDHIDSLKETVETLNERIQEVEDAAREDTERRDV